MGVSQNERRSAKERMSRSLCYWVGWPAGNPALPKPGAGTKKTPRCPRRQCNHHLKRSTCYFACWERLAAFLRFFGMEQISSSFSSLLCSAGKLANFAILPACNSLLVHPQVVNRFALENQNWQR